MSIDQLSAVLVKPFFLANLVAVKDVLHIFSQFFIYKTQCTYTDTERLLHLQNMAL